MRCQSLKYNKILLMFQVRLRKVPLTLTGFFSMILENISEESTPVMEDMEEPAGEAEEEIAVDEPEEKQTW